MNIKEITAAVVAMNKPEHKADGMVYQVWEDGEITLQKGGSLFGQRTLHTIEQEHTLKSIDPNRMPNINRSGHGYIIVGSYEEAQEARALIFSVNNED